MFAWGPVSSAPRPSPQRYPAARIALWQVLASAVVASLGGWWAGWHGAVSGLLGGLVNVSAGIVFAMLVWLGRPASAAATVSTMIRAEAAKIAVVTSAILGGLVLGFLWLVTRKASAGVPSKTEAFVELTIEFVNDQVRSMFHHDYKVVAPIALTVGLWVLFMNAMDFLPVDIMA